MNISIRSNIDQVLGFTARINPQFKFATALALTTLARKGQADLAPVLQRSIDRPTPFTQQGFFVTPARKDNLQAVVGVKDKQAGYLQYQIQGGTRRPSNVALRLPTAVQLNEFGNLPAGVIKQLIARAQAGRHATKRQSQRFGVSQELNLFYGDPKDGRPPGLYKRVVISATRHQLVPLIVFPRRSAKYRARFDFFGALEASVRRNADGELRAAWARAIRSAR